MILLVSFLTILCIHSGLTRTNAATVHGILTITRGSSSSLEGLYNASYSSKSSTCTVQFLRDVGNHCGDVTPASLPCDNNRFTYYHYGCLAQYETLNFRLISEETTNGKVITQVFSIPVHVLASKTLLELTVVPKEVGSELAIHCPPSFVDHCFYTILTNRQSLSLPSMGDIKGQTNQRIPCGFSPSSSFIYTSEEDDPHDAILVQLHCMNYTDTRFYVLPFGGNTTTHLPLQTIPKAYLRVYELSTTKLPSDLLELQSLAAKYKVLELAFPIQSVGGLFSLFSANKGFLDSTTFTFSELQRGMIVFIPDESSAAAYISMVSQFHYYVSDITGRPIAEGILEIQLSPRVGQRTSLRKNSGLSLYPGMSVIYNSTHLDFYPPSECLNYILEIESPPIFGSLLSNETQLKTGSIVTIAGGNQCLTYIHNNSIETYDLIGFNIHCDGYPPFQTSVPIHILTQTHNIPDHITTPLITYFEYGSPLFSSGECLPNESISMISFQSGTESDQVFYFNATCQYSIYGYPYIHQNDILKNECFTVINDSNDLKNITDFSSLWYIPQVDENRTAHSFNMSIVYNDNIIGVTVNVIILYSTPQKDFTPVSVMNTLDYKQSYPSLPYLQHNQPLPLSTPNPVHITNQYLYVHSLGYLQSEIIYHIILPPKHGLLCILYQPTCSSSVNQFTQEDILADRVYYQPSSVSDTEQDSFNFDVYYMNDVKLEGPNTFSIHTVEDASLVKDGNLFWVPVGRSRPLLHKHLRYLNKHVKVSKSHFVVLEGPHYGFLESNTKNEFSWQEIKKRSVVYHHNEDNVACSDWLLLSVSDGKEVIITNITIPIRLDPEATLNLNEKEHRLEGGNSFILSTNDLRIGSRFCPDFVQLTIIEPPHHGLLMLSDPKYGINRHILKNGSFLADDIQHGRVQYLIFPDLALLDDTRDSFLFTVEDPSGIYASPSKLVTRDTNSNPYSFIFYIVATPFEGSGEFLTLNVSTSSPKQITKLDESSYGTIFGPEDISIIDNSDLVPTEIHFNVHQPPTYGKLVKDNNKAPVANFTLADIHSRKISYISNILHNNILITSDVFRFSVFVYLSNNNTNTSIRVILDKEFILQWCFFSIEFIKPEDSYVNETDSKVQFSVKQIGSTSSSPTTVNIMTQSINNTHGVDCNLLSIPKRADFCNINQRLTFEPGNTKHTVSVPIIDNSVPEGQEEFRVKLEEPSGCLIPKWSERPIYIADYEDYSSVGFSSDGFSTTQSQYIHEECPLYIKVAENEGIVNIPLFRDGYLNQYVEVICYTKQKTSKNDSPDSSNNSIAYFREGETNATCSFTIVNDDKNENLEFFYVKLKISEGFAYVNYANYPVCVFIKHDKKDEPSVFFNNPQIIVPESQQQVNVIIQRTGDLSKPTEVTCVVYSNNGTSVYNEDYHVVFKREQNETFFTIIVHPVVEGTEVLSIHMKEPYDGQMRTPNVAQVVILNVKQDVTTGFKSDTFVVQETQGLIHVPIYRKGNIATNSTVGCILHTGTADSSDFVISPHVQLVTFPINSTQATCSVYILNDDIREGNESFSITISTDDPSIVFYETRITVIIQDPEDDVTIGFKSDTFVVQETQGLIHVPMYRKGNIATNSTVGCILHTGTADYSDFVISPHVQLVTFPINSTQATCSVYILNDDIREGNESFSITISTDDPFIVIYETRIIVIIQDPEDGVTIGLISDTIVVQEPQGLIHVPMYRYGNITTKSIVKCVVHTGTANSSDFVILQRLVVFPINSTQAACSVYIKNDARREGNETFSISISTDDPFIYIARKRITVIIQDPEDAPRIQMEFPSYSIKEPLSNSLLDLQEIRLTVLRTGDLSVDTSILYYTLNGTARSDVGFIYSKGVIRFGKDESRKNIKIRILADHQISVDKRFYIMLEVDSGSDPDVVIEPSKVQITIINIVPRVSFPDLPMIGSLVQYNNTSTLNYSQSYYDQPLVCITPCDNDHPNRTLYHSECNRQQIAQELTEYEWEMSRDGIHFTSIELDTLFTSVHGKVLEPVYMEMGIWIQCRVTAVDISDVRGYSRVSSPVFINKQFSPCCNNNNITINATISSYKTFSGQNEDLLNLQFSFPGVQNFIPLITTSPYQHAISLLTQPAIRSKHMCSSFTPSDFQHHDFISKNEEELPHYREPKSYRLYRHYDVLKCEWKFSTWIPVATLRDLCSANVSTDNLKITLPLYMIYYHIANGTTVTMTTMSQQLVSFSANPNNESIQLPFDYLPVDEEDDQLLPLIHPVVIESNITTNKLLWLIRSHSNSNWTFEKSLVGITWGSNRYESRYKHVYPVSTNRTKEGIQQDWLFEIIAPNVTRFSLIFVLKCCSSCDYQNECGGEKESYTYLIPVDIEDDGFGTQVMTLRMSLQGEAREVDDSELASTNVSVRGAHVIEAIVSLNSHQLLRPNYSIRVVSVLVCSAAADLTVENGGCNNNEAENIQLLTSYQLVQNEPRRITIYFNMDNLNEEISNNTRYLHITCELHSTLPSLTAPNNQDILIPIPSTPNNPSTSPVPTTTSTPNDSSMPVYALVLVSVMLATLLFVCSITGLLFLYTSRQRYLLNQQKLKVEREKIYKNNNMSYERRYIGRYIPCSQRPFWYLRKNTSEGNTQPTTINSENDTQDLKSTTLPSQLSKATPYRTLLNNNNPQLNVLSHKQEETTQLVAMVKPQFPYSGIQKEISSSIIKMTNTDDRKINTDDSSIPVKQVNPPAHVSFHNPGWYELHQSREKAMAAYAQIYHLTDGPRAQSLE